MGSTCGKDSRGDNDVVVEQQQQSSSSTTTRAQETKSPIKATPTSNKEDDGSGINDDAVVSNSQEHDMPSLSKQKSCYKNTHFNQDEIAAIKSALTAVLGKENHKNDDNSTISLSEFQQVLIGSSSPSSSSSSTNNCPLYIRRIFDLYKEKDSKVMTIENVLSFLSVLSVKGRNDEKEKLSFDILAHHHQDKVITQESTLEILTSVFRMLSSRRPFVSDNQLRNIVASTFNSSNVITEEQYHDIFDRNVISKTSYLTVDTSAILAHFKRKAL